MTVLIVTSAWDVAADLVIQELSARDQEIVRLNTEAFPTEVRLTYQTFPTPSWRAEVSPGRLIDSSNIESIYYRRPKRPYIDPDVKDPIARKFAETESRAAIHGILRCPTARWINHPSLIAEAEYKPAQLGRAAAIGIAIPRTIITNDPEFARDFAASARSVVVKSIRSPVVSESPPRFVYTTRLKTTDPLIFDDISLAPCIVQEWVEKDVEVRVTVVGDQAFAAEIDSQSQAGAEVDWRRVAPTCVTHRIHKLPRKISEQCIQLTRSFGLLFSAIDLIRTPSGEYVFLEINPNGEWAWIATLTGLPIASALADLLCTTPGT